MSAGPVVTTSRRWWLLIPAVVVLTAAVLYGGRTVLIRSNDTDAARLRALEARLAALEGRPRGGATAIPGSGGTPHLVLPGPPPERGAGEEAPAPAAAPPRLTEKHGAVDEVALQRAYFGELDARLAGETRDPVWAAPTEELLRGSTHDQRPQISVENAQCGETLCRVETSVPDLREEIPALNKFLTATVTVLPEAVVRDGDQPGRHVVYFARKAGGFPAMTAEPETASP
jgi:hypothetical protein